MRAAIAERANAKMNGFLVFTLCVIAVCLFMHFSPPKVKARGWPIALLLGTAGAIYSVSVSDVGVLIYFFYAGILVSLIHAYFCTRVCPSCGHIARFRLGKPKPEICLACGERCSARSGGDENNENATPKKAVLPPLPEPPTCFSVVSTESTCSIRHRRTGMRAMNWFLGVFLLGWTVGFALLSHQFFYEDLGEDGSSMQGWALMLLFLASWLVIAVWLVYSVCAQKTFVLGKASLRIETDLLGIRRQLAVPRDAISQIRQLKDGGNDGDSFPSWCLEIESAVAEASIIDRILSLNYSGRLNRFRILSRLPYEQSEWLGIVIAHWSGAELTLCPSSASE